MIDISNLSVNELTELRSRIDQQIKTRKVEEVTKAREQILALASSLGMKVAEIVGTKGNGKAGAKKPVAVRYQNPDNSNEQWTGRGRQPKWLKDLVESGKSLDDLKVG